MYTGTTATFAPASSLAYGTQYTATITTGAASLVGTPLTANYVWNFTTITPVPTVTAAAPVNGATGVPINQVLSATFSEGMNPATLSAATFTLTGANGVSVPGAVTYSGLSARFIPTANLAYSASYTATITTGAEDLAGTPLIANYVWTFTTISPTPAIISTVPVNSATGVPVSQALSATFNRGNELCDAYISCNDVHSHRPRHDGCSGNSQLHRERRDLHAKRDTCRQYLVYSHHYHRGSGSGGARHWPVIICGAS